MTTQGVMTAEQLQLWRKLAYRFQTLSPSLPDGYDRTVIRSIQPTVDTHWLDCEQFSTEAAANLSGTAGNFVALATVGEDELWHVTWAFRVATAVASTAWGYQAQDGNTMEMEDSVATLYAKAIDLWLGPGCVLGTFATGDVGDTGKAVRFNGLIFKTVDYLRPTTDSP